MTPEQAEAHRQRAQKQIDKFGRTHDQSGRGRKTPFPEPSESERTHRRGDIPPEEPDRTRRPKRR